MSVDNKYLNITITPATTSASPFSGFNRADYDITASRPIIDDPSKYYASIVRFVLPTSTIPIFSFPVDVTQNNPLVSALVIGIETTSGQQFLDNIDYFPQNNLPVPVPAATPPYFSYDQVISPFYFIYNVTPFITMVNVALAGATLLALGPTVTAPYYNYFPSSQQISLIVAQNFIATGANIILNSALKVYFNSFAFFNEITPSGQFFFRHILSPLPYNAPVGGPYVFAQEYNAMPLWFDVSKIVITTSSIPVLPEFSPTYSSAIRNLNGTANQFPIITDFAISYNGLNDFGTVIVYNPTAQYRLVDMNSSVPLSRIQLSFYWLSKNGTLYPVYLASGQSASLKIGFFKKELYKQS